MVKVAAKAGAAVATDRISTAGIPLDARFNKLQVPRNA